MSDTPAENPKPKSPMARRFRGFLPVVMDIETGGFNKETDAILEIAACIITMDDDGELGYAPPIFYRVKPFEGANIEKSALDFLGIDIHHPFRMASSEQEALEDICKQVKKAQKDAGCSRAVLVGHNSWFDLGFLNTAIKRCALDKRNPFHPFTSFDTASLAGLTYGQTVLARACQAAGIAYNNEEAHSARYDAEVTADLFCRIVNQWKRLGGWPP